MWYPTSYRNRHKLYECDQDICEGWPSSLGLQNPRYWIRYSQSKAPGGEQGSRGSITNLETTECDGLSAIMNQMHSEGAVTEAQAGID